MGKGCTYWNRVILASFVSPLSYAHPQAKQEGFHQEAERWGNILLSGNLLEIFRELFLEAQGTHAFLRSGPSRFREFWNFFFFFGALDPFGRRQWHPTPVLLPGKSHGRKSLVGCSPWGH